MTNHASLKMAPYQRLVNIFARAALAGVLSATPLYAQDAETNLDHSSDADMSVAFNGAQDQLPDYLRFKPLAICQEAEANLSDSVKARALDDDAFASTQDWADTDDAADIMTYRLCREEDPAAMGDSVLIDVMKRLDNKAWIAETVRPFMEEDPGLYYKALNFSVSIDGVTQSGNAVTQRYGSTPDSYPITFSADRLLEQASDPMRAERILDSKRRFAGLPEYEEIVRAVFVADPLLIFKFPRTFDEVSRGQPLPDNLASILMDAAGNPKRAQTLILQYDSYSELPEAVDIVQAAIATVPSYYLKYYAGGQGAELSEALRDPVFFPSAQQLRNAVLNTADRGVSVRNIMRYREYYDHLPEADEIFRSAIDTAPALYFKLLQESVAFRAMMGDTPPVPRMDVMLKIASERENVRSLLRNYSMYKDVTGAQDVARAAIATRPEVYIELAGMRQYRALAGDDSLFPSAQLLLDAAQDSESAYVFMTGYDVYKHLPEAKQILRHAIGAAPMSFLKKVRYNEISDEILSDPDLFPSADQIIGAMASSLNAASDLIYYYPAYEHLPRAKDIARAAIEAVPLTYFRALTRESLSEALKQDDSVFPSETAVLGSIKTFDGVRIALTYYKQYEHMPWAPNVLREAARVSPRFTLREIHDTAQRGADAENAFDTDLNRQLLINVFEERPDYLSETLAESYEYLYMYLTLARDYPPLMDFILDTLEDKGNSAGTLYFLGHPFNKQRVELLDDQVQDRLQALAQPALQGDCGRHHAYFNLLKEGSWPVENGRITQEQLSFAIGCALEYDVFIAIEKIEKNARLSFQPDVLRGAIMQRPLFFLERSTKDEKAEGYSIQDARIPYEDLLQAAREKLSVEDLGYRDRPRGIYIVNNLHNYDDDTRFAVLRDLTNKNRLRFAAADDDIYYTSSFNRIMADALDVLERDEDARAWLFGSDDGQENTGYGVQNSILLQMTMNAMHFGKLEEFLGILTPDEVEIVAGKVMDNLSRSRDRYGSSRTAVLTATVLPVLEFMAAGGYGAQVEQSIIAQYIDADDETLRSAMGILASLYRDNNEITPQNEAFFGAANDSYASVLRNYMRDTLLTDDLFDDQGRNFQMMVFYDDRDGHASFGHFKSVYQSDNRWRYRNHGEYISFTRGGITLYANKPQHEGAGNKAIIETVTAQGGEISVLVHRGHSYHVKDTADGYLNEDVKFFWLGSCRSSSIWGYIDEAPDMQFIYSQNVGTMLINDPLLKNINDTLVRDRNISWPQIRDDAYRLSNGDRRVKDYIFPDGSIEYGMRMTIALFAESLELRRAAETAVLASIGRAEADITPAPTRSSVSYSAPQYPYPALRSE